MHKWKLSKDTQPGWFYIFVEAFRVAATRPGGHFLIAVSEKIIQLTISSNFYKLFPTTPNNFYFCSSKTGWVWDWNISITTYSTIGQVSSLKHGTKYKYVCIGMIHCPHCTWCCGSWTTFCSFECHVVWISSVTRIWSEIKWTPISQHMIATRSKSHQKSPNITKNQRKLQQI